MSCTADDFALNQDYLVAFASGRTSGSMSGATTTDNDQFLIHVHVDEVTGSDVVVVEVELLVDVVVVSPKLGNVVGGTAILLGQ